VTHPLHPRDTFKGRHPIEVRFVCSIVDSPLRSSAYLQAGAVEEIKVASAFRVSWYFVVLALVWMVAMTWHIYPQFRDTIRVHGRLTTINDYVAEACGERIGPVIADCVARTEATAQRLLHREQGKSILLIDAPLLGYVLIYLPLRLMIDSVRRRRDGGIGSSGDLRAAGGVERVSTSPSV
jgi:hypothetical protein